MRADKEASGFLKSLITADFATGHIKYGLVIDTDAGCSRRLIAGYSSSGDTDGIGQPESINSTETIRQ